LSNAPVAGDAGVHLTPDDGLQTFVEPYPRFTGGDQSGTRLDGRAVVNVVAVQGTWAQVAVEGAIVGWVDGRRLLPPLGGSAVHPSSVAMPAPEHETRSVISLDLGAIVGLIGSVGILVGSAMTWVRFLFIGVSSYDIAFAFLFDDKTRSHNPRLGAVLVVLGVIGIIVSLFARAGFGRVLVGALALGFAVLYLIQVARATSNGPQSFGDVIGAGAWVTGGAGLLLVLSPLFHRRVLTAV
jgi:hypothetical protein